MINNVTMMGLGYIGLPTATVIANKEIRVVGVDVKQEVVDKINKGEIHIVEPDLAGLVEYVVKKRYLKASIKPIKSDVFLIAVPTPFKGDYEPDIKYVQSAIESIIPVIEEKNLLIIESTSPVGTTEKMYDLICNKRPELKDKFYMAYCPERVLPGKVIFELENNDRVIGGINEDSSQKAKEFYSKFVNGNLYKTTDKTAELCKLVENSYRDVNIAFANELSIISEKYDVNVWELIKLANKHPRVNILQPGCGVGGHCISVDPWFIVHDNKDTANIIHMARKVNNFKPQWVINKVKSNLINKNSKVACLGLAFKPNIDDLRESPALEITKQLIEENINILPVEPNIKDHSSLKIYNYEEAIKESQIILVLVKHKEFENINYNELRNQGKIVIDVCGVEF